MITLQKRTCIKCKAVKPFSDFHKNARTSEGINNECKICKNSRSKQRYQESGELLRAQMAFQRVNSYQHRLSIERASRERRKAFQRPRKNARQQIRNRLLVANIWIIKDSEINALYSRPCYNCGTKENLSIDHNIPLSRGGRHSIGNLQTLCRPCNSSKGDKFFMAWKLYKLKNGVG
jgi:5-methylcytosine-specific restriction endonuclease McrA